MEEVENKKEYITIKKTTLVRTLRILFYIYLLVFTVVVTVLITRQTKTINELKETISSINLQNSQDQIESLQISDMAYYPDYELDNSMQIELEEGKDFMIYFHSRECQYCLEANVYLNQYITLGYQDYVPVYFATYDKSPDLFENDKFVIESTPTMVYFDSSEETYSLYEGVDDILTLLDNLVKDANNEQ